MNFDFPKIIYSFMKKLQFCVESLACLSRNFFSSICKTCYLWTSYIKKRIQLGSYRFVNPVNRQGLKSQVFLFLVVLHRLTSNLPARFYWSGSQSTRLPWAGYSIMEYYRFLSLNLKFVGLKLLKSANSDDFYRRWNIWFSSNLLLKFHLSTSQLKNWKLWKISQLKCFSFLFVNSKALRSKMTYFTQT